MQTLEKLITEFGVDVHEHLDRDELVPVHSSIQRQGDVAFIPVDSRPSAGHRPIPAAGVAVVRGENGGNTHLLLGQGTYRSIVSSDPSDTLIGELVVGEGETAYVAHSEHGYLGIGPGVYQARRKREQADVVRRIAD